MSLTSSSTQSTPFSTWFLHHFFSKYPHLKNDTEKAAEAIFLFISLNDYNFVSDPLDAKVTQIQTTYLDNIDKIIQGKMEEVFDITRNKQLGNKTPDANVFYQQELDKFLRKHTFPFQLYKLFSRQGILATYELRLNHFDQWHKTEQKYLSTLFTLLEFFRGQSLIQVNNCPKAISALTKEQKEGFLQFLISKSALCSSNIDQSWFSLIIEWSHQSAGLVSKMKKLFEYLDRDISRFMQPSGIAFGGDHAQLSFEEFLVKKSYDCLLETIALKELPACLEALIKKTFRENEAERKLILMGFTIKYRHTAAWKSLCSQNQSVCYYIDQFLELTAFLNDDGSSARFIFNQLLHAQQIEMVKALVKKNEPQRMKEIIDKAEESKYFANNRQQNPQNNSSFQYYVNVAKRFEIIHDDEQPFYVYLEPIVNNCHGYKIVEPIENFFYCYKFNRHVDNDFGSWVLASKDPSERGKALLILLNSDKNAINVFKEKCDFIENSRFLHVKGQHYIPLEFWAHLLHDSGHEKFESVVFRLIGLYSEMSTSNPDSILPFLELAKDNVEEIKYIYHLFLDYLRGKYSSFAQVQVLHYIYHQTGPNHPFVLDLQVLHKQELSDDKSVLSTISTKSNSSLKSELEEKCSTSSSFSQIETLAYFLNEKSLKPKLDSFLKSLKDTLEKFDLPSEQTMLLFLHLMSDLQNSIGKIKADNKEEQIGALLDAKSELLAHQNYLLYQLQTLLTHPLSSKFVFSWLMYLPERENANTIIKFLNSFCNGIEKAFNLDPNDIVTSFTPPIGFYKEIKSWFSQLANHQMIPSEIQSTQAADFSEQVSQLREEFLSTRTPATLKMLAPCFKESKKKEIVQGGVSKTRELIPFSGNICYFSDWMISGKNEPPRFLLSLIGEKEAIKFTLPLPWSKDKLEENPELISQLYKALLAYGETHSEMILTSLDKVIVKHGISEETQKINTFLETLFKYYSFSVAWLTRSSKEYDLKKIGKIIDLKNCHFFHLSLMQNMSLSHMDPSILSLASLPQGAEEIIKKMVHSIRGRMIPFERNYDFPRDELKSNSSVSNSYPISQVHLSFNPEKLNEVTLKIGEASQIVYYRDLIDADNFAKRLEWQLLTVVSKAVR